MKAKFTLKITILIFLIFILIIISLNMGSAKISPKEVFEILTTSIQSTKKVILIKIRMPRIFMSLLVGMSLAISGSIFQIFFKNPMADPYILGISSGSSFGAIMSYLLFNNFLQMTIGAFLGALFSVFIIFSIWNKLRMDSSYLLLTGVCMNFLFNSINSFLLLLKKDGIEKIFFWMMGSFSASNYFFVIILSVSLLICISFIFLYKDELLIMHLEDESAQSLGVDVKKIKKYFIFLSSILIAISVSSSGTIAFIGLIIPQISRKTIANSGLKSIIGSGFLGAIFLLICDTFSRSFIESSEIPVGVITSFIGSLYFFYLLIINKKQRIN